MSTQNKTSSTNSYNPQSMGMYNSLQPGIASNWNQAMSNPQGSTFFQQQSNMGYQNNARNATSANASFLNNINNSGFSSGNLNPFQLSMLNQNSRQLSANNSNMFTNLLNNTNQFRFGATQNAMGYRPLQTGGTQISQITGTGTWMPQVAQGAVQGLATAKSLMDQDSFNYSGANATPMTQSAWNSPGTNTDPGPSFSGNYDMPNIGGYNDWASMSQDQPFNPSDPSMNPFMPSF